MGALCHVGGGDACSELISYVTGGIQSNLERDSREIDQHSDLVEKLAHSPSSSPTSRENEDRVGIMHVTPLLHVQVSHALSMYDPSLGLPLLLMYSMTLLAGGTWRPT